jgi:hypothetical protein
MKIPPNIYNNLMPDIEIQIACHPFYGNDSYRVISTFFNSIQDLSADNLEIGSNEVTMLCSRFGKVTKIKAIIDKDDNGFNYKILEDGALYHEEENQPIDTLMVELLENPSLKIQDFIDNQHGVLYLEHLITVVCEFYRLAFDPRLIQNKHKVLMDEQAKVEASILHKAWLMLQRIAYLENEAHLQDEIVMIFRSLVFCGELLTPTRSKNINRKYKKTELVQQIQSENKLLHTKGFKSKSKAEKKMLKAKGIESESEAEKKLPPGKSKLIIPFTKDSVSYLFIKRAIHWADNDRDFRKYYYTPLIEARMQLPGCLLDGNNNIKLFGKDIKPEHRGRPRGKKKPKNHS